MTRSPVGTTITAASFSPCNANPVSTRSKWATKSGRSPFRRRVERLARDRLHHHFHDAVIGGGVHPSAVHGWHSGALVARVCRHHHGGRAGVGFCLADAHPDVVQPFRQTARATKAW